jgi:hypothetical protein
MIIICTNSGRLRAFRISQPETEVDPGNQIQEIASETFDDGPQKVGQINSDKAGRFRQDGNPGMAHGEDQGLAREEERRLIQQLAEKITSLVQAEGDDRWSLAAPGTINSRVVDELEPAVRGKLVDNQNHDFTKLPTLEVGRRFGLIK